MQTEVDGTLEPVAEDPCSKAKSGTFASTAKKGEPKHPRKAVMNALTHRGDNAVATRGRSICYSHDAPNREGRTAVKADGYH